MPLADFDFLVKIGEGSFGVIHKVRRRADGKVYAMKQMGTSGLTEVEQADALNEVKVLASLSHPYIVRYYESFRSNSDGAATLSIVMEWASEGDLSSHLKALRARKRKMKEADVWQVLLQLGSALEYIHSKKILHRDLKSLNVFLSAPASPGAFPCAQSGSRVQSIRAHKPIGPIDLGLIAPTPNLMRLGHRRRLRAGLGRARGGRDVRLGDFGVSKVLDSTAAVAMSRVCARRPPPSHRPHWRRRAGLSGGDGGGAAVRRTLCRRSCARISRESARHFFYFKK
eukprot:SAG11_NODE_4945_length_1714_cov_2.774613_2_plen_284_part_00